MCLGVGFVLFGPDVRLGQHVEALGVCRHYPVLDAVVDHLDEVASATRAAVQPPAFFGSGITTTAGSAFSCSDAGGQRVED